jgi:hypothetical protein
MKTKFVLLAATVALSSTLGVLGQSSRSTPIATPAANTRVGIYDSRAVSFAYCWSATGRQAREALIAEAKVARAQGNRPRFAELNARLVALQKRNHLQVFSTEPAGEALAALGPQLPSLQAELGVQRLVSKWDAAGLGGVPTADQVDVTDRLVQALFTPTPQQAKMLEELKHTPPIPIEEARRLADEGKM